jgi:hypothetical protein
MIRKFIGAFAALVMLVSLLGVAPAAAKAPVERENFVDTVVPEFNEGISDLCGVPVVTAGEVRVRLSFYADGSMRIHENGFITHTNSLTGETLNETWAANFWVNVDEVEEGSVLTIDETVRVNGMPIKFSARGMGVIGRDAGTLTFHNTIVLDFSLPGDPFVSFDQEIVKEGGPHPLFGEFSDELLGELCGAVGGALGG